MECQMEFYIRSILLLVITAYVKRCEGNVFSRVCLFEQRACILYGSVKQSYTTTRYQHRFIRTSGRKPNRSDRKVCNHVLMYAKFVGSNPHQYLWRHDLQIHELKMLTCNTNISTISQCHIIGKSEDHYR